MAIYHFNAAILSRSTGRSAVAASAYRAGEALSDLRTGIRHDYHRRRCIAFSEIIAPTNAPSWVQDRSQLWNGVEAAEKREDAQLAREIEVALPLELSLQDGWDLVREFVRSELVNQGMVADVALHANSGNPHAHILATLRSIGPTGFGLKAREWNVRAFLEGLRQSWAEHVNRALAKSNSSARVDHRSLAAQGIEREPQRHQGPPALAMSHRGAQANRKATPRKQRNQEEETDGPQQPQRAHWQRSGNREDSRRPEHGRRR